jgi:hypothetical protein
MAQFWNRKRERAALQVAEDALTDAAIAEQAGVSKQTLENWKLRPDFRARVQEHVAAFAEAVRAEGIANHKNRVAALNDRWRKMQTVIDARAEAHDGQAPGAGTGLLVRQEKQIGAGERAVHVVEWRVDDGLLSELRQHEKQAAQELGQWTDKSEVAGKDGGPQQHEILHRGAIEVRAVDYRVTAAALRPVDGDET